MRRAPPGSRQAGGVGRPPPVGLPDVDGVLIPDVVLLCLLVQEVEEYFGRQRLPAFRAPARWKKLSTNCCSVPCGVGGVSFVRGGEGEAEPGLPPTGLRRTLTESRRVR